MSASSLRIPARTAALASLIAVWIVFAPVAPAAEAPVFAGSATDTVGNRLSGVEVLLVAQNPTPVARTLSDDAGRFSLADLTPGLYSIAAVKRGYLTYVGQVNTRLQTWIDLVLQPSAGGGSTEPPVEASWTLRVPRRSVLREVEEPDVTSGILPSEPTPSSMADDRWQMAVSQQFAVQAGLRGDEASDDRVGGAETRIGFASGIGERGNLRVDGYREALDSSSAVDSDRSSLEREAASLQVALGYDTSRESNLRVRAFYGTRDLSWSAVLSELDGDAVRQAQRSWGTDASWSRQLDENSSLALRVDYRNAALEQSVGPIVGAPPLANRSLAASASFLGRASRSHELRVAVRARQLESSLTDVRAVGAGAAGAFDGIEGLSLGIDTQDTWRVDGAIAVISGLEYRHASDDVGGALLVPRVGGSWSMDHLAVRLLVSYERAAKLGYDAFAEVPLPHQLRLAASSSYRPVRLDMPGTDDPAGDTLIPVYLTDGNAGLSQNRLSVTKEGAVTRTFLELSRGTADGRLAAVLPYEIAFQELSERSLDFRAGRLGLHVVPTGTDVVLEYSRVEERGDPAISAGSSPNGSMQRSVELRLAQDVMRRRDLGNWRFLMAVRMASLVADINDDAFEGTDVALLDSLSRVSAGLSVEF